MNPNDMIQAIIIDDEEISLRALADKISKSCPYVQVLKVFSKPGEALKEIEELSPDVVFLDIEMPKISGFTFLKQCSRINFEVVFTTAYSSYAIDALRISALDFLLKPIDIKELESAMGRLREKIRNKRSENNYLEEQVRLFFQCQQPSNQPVKIALPVLNGLEFVDVATIIKVEGENVYSSFYLSTGKKIMVSRTLKEVDKMLGRWNFMRVHKSYIVNLNYVDHYIKGEGGSVILSDGSEVEVSRRSKNEFLARINK